MTTNQSVIELVEGLASFFGAYVFCSYLVVWYPVTDPWIIEILIILSITLYRLVLVPLFKILGWHPDPHPLAPDAPEEEADAV